MPRFLLRKRTSLRDVFSKRVDKYQNTIGFTDFINCLNIADFNLVAKDEQVLKTFIVLLDKNARKGPKGL